MMEELFLAILGTNIMYIQNAWMTNHCAHLINSKVEPPAPDCSLGCDGYLSMIRTYSVVVTKFYLPWVQTELSWILSIQQGTVDHGFNYEANMYYYYLLYGTFTSHFH